MYILGAATQPAESQIENEQDDKFPALPEPSNLVSVRYRILPYSNVHRTISLPKLWGKLRACVYNVYNSTGQLNMYPT